MDGMMYAHGWMSRRRVGDMGDAHILGISLDREAIERDLASVGYKQSSQPRLWIRGVGDCVDVLPMTVEYATPE